MEILRLWKRSVTIRVSKRYLLSVPQKLRRSCTREQQINTNAALPLVMPDAIPGMTAENVVASMSGCAGQRCMAASAMVGVGDIDHIIDRICVEARKIVPGKNLGAVISKE